MRRRAAYLESLNRNQRSLEVIRSHQKSLEVMRRAAYLESLNRRLLGECTLRTE